MGHCSTYEVRFPIPERLHIYIKMLTGHIIPLDVRSSDTILKVKEMVQEKDGFAVDTQWMIYSGKILENDRTLRDYYVQMESVIHLVLRLRPAPERRYRYNPSPWTSKPRKKGKRAVRKNDKVTEKGKNRQQVTEKGKNRQQVTEKGKNRQQVTEKGKNRQQVTEKGKNRQQVNKKGKNRQQVNKKGKIRQQVNKKGKSRCQRRERTSDQSGAGTSKQL